MQFKTCRPFYWDFGLNTFNLTMSSYNYVRKKHGNMQAMQGACLFCFNGIYIELSVEVKLKNCISVLGYFFLLMDEDVSFLFELQHMFTNL